MRSFLSFSMQPFAPPFLLLSVQGEQSGDTKGRRWNLFLYSFFSYQVVMDYGSRFLFSHGPFLETSGRACLRFVLSVSVALVYSMTDMGDRFSGSFYHLSLFLLR